MSSTCQSAFAAFHSSVISESIGEQAEERGLKGDVSVLPLTYVDDMATTVGIATMCGCAGNAADNLLCQMHKQALANQNGRGLISIQTALIWEGIKFHKYPYTFESTKEVLSKLAGVYSANVYTWDEMTRVGP